MDGDLFAALTAFRRVLTGLLRAMKTNESYKEKGEKQRIKRRKERRSKGKNGQHA
jgi:hypothetical protein